MNKERSDTSAATLDYAPPPVDLRGHLTLFYDFRADAQRWTGTDRADRAQFRFLLSGEGHYHFADGTVQCSFPIQIVGPTTGPVKIDMTGPVHSFGVGLQPAGWGTLLDFEAPLLVNRVIDATQLFGPGLQMTATALRAATSIEERVAIGSALARTLIGRGTSPAFAFTRIVDAWLASSSTPSLDELSMTTGLSRRQIERQCNAYYGAPPKLLARKYRALKAAIAIAQGTADIDDLIADGFYDQSHFIREIKAFTGVTPSRIAEDLPELTTLTLKRTPSPLQSD